MQSNKELLNTDISICIKNCCDKHSINSTQDIRNFVRNVNTQRLFLIYGWIWNWKDNMLFRNWKDNMLRLGEFCYFLWHSTDRGFVRISYRGILEPFEKTVSSYREAGYCIYSHVESLNKKVSHFQTFSLDVLIFIANAVNGWRRRNWEKGIDLLVGGGRGGS
jgi:hypothetical protein